MRALRWALLIILITITAAAVWHYEPDRSLEELSEYLNDESEFVEVLGMNVHFRREGPEGAPIIVLLHGNSASLHTWDGWVEVLAQHYEIVRLDLPAFGLTGPNPSGDYRTSWYVEFLEQFREALGLEQFALTGNSLGGNIAWQYTLQQPDRVSQLILLDPSGMPLPEVDTPFVFRLAAMPVISDFFASFAPEALYRSSLLDVYADDSLVTDTLVKRYRDLSLFAGNRKAFVEAGQQYERAPIERLNEIRAPTLILWGGQDLWIPPSDAETFHAEISESELTIYPDLGHLPMEEAPTRTAEDVHRFLLATSNEVAP
ncbi:MAG: alpha/beta hydrolase [Pseudomonadota bacterium]